MKRSLIAYILNFIIVGSGFALYRKSLVGFIYLILYMIAWAFHEEIGAIWAILIMIASYIHLYKIIASQKDRSDHKSKHNDFGDRAVKELHEIYDKVRLKFPHKKEIFYLSLTWAIYAKKYSKQSKDNDLSFLLIPGGTQSLLFSFLDYPDSIDALSYYWAIKTFPEESKHYEPEFDLLSAKVDINKINTEEETQKMVTYLMDEGKLVEGRNINDF